MIVVVVFVLSVAATWWTWEPPGRHHKPRIRPPYAGRHLLPRGRAVASMGVPA